MALTGALGRAGGVLAVAGNPVFRKQLMKHLPIGIIGWEHDFNRAAQGLFAVIGEGASGAFGLHGGLRRQRVLSAMVRSAFGEAAVRP